MTTSFPSQPDSDGPHFNRPESDRPDSEEPDLLTSLHVRRAIDGETKSLTWMVQRSSPLLLAQARYRLGPSLRKFHDPEDLVQDVWVRVLPKLDTLSEAGGRFTPVVLKVLTTTLLHRVKDLFEKHVLNKPGQVEAGLEHDPLQGVPAEVTGVLTQMARRDNKDALAETLERMVDTDREVLVLRGIEQRGNKEVAALLGLEEGTASVRYRRALQRLEEKLPPEVLADLRG